MRKILKIVLFSIVLFMANDIYGQRYENSIGLKAGSGYYLAYKHHLGEDFALEALMGNYEQSFSIGLVGHIQYENDWLNDQLNIYYGGGAVIKFVTSVANFGIVGVGGAEYVMESIPLAFSLEIAPGLLFGSGGGLKGNVLGGFTFRYILNY